MQQQMDVNQVMGLLCAFIGVVLVVVLIIVVFYLLTLQKALSRVSPRNRLMEPGMVWLMLVPCVNLVWQFFIAIRVPGSLQNEFRDRGQDDGSDYGKSLALTQVILGIVSSVISNGSNAGGQDAALVGNLVGGVASLIGFVLFIVFWVKIAGYSRQLAEDAPRRRDWERKLGEFDDDADEFGRGSGDKPPDTYREGDPGGFKPH